MIFSKAKKLILAAMVGLCAGFTACVDDESGSFPVSLGSEKEYVLAVDVPEGFRSRAAQYYGDGALNELHLKYAVYGYDGKLVYSSDDAKSPIPSVVANGSWQLRLRLADEMDYSVFFWADQFGVAPNTPYSVDLKEATLDVDYDKAFTHENLMTDRCDAYTLYKAFTPSDGLTFTLKRPFCQVNVGSPEAAAVDAANAKHKSYVAVGWDDEASFVTGVNFKTGAVKVKNNPGFAAGNFPDWLPCLNISDFDGTDFDFIGNDDAEYMYMAYLLVDGTEETLNLHILDDQDKYIHYHPDVTGKVAANNRLIIVPDGAFLDYAKKFIISFDPGFNGGNLVTEPVQVDVYHTVSWTLGEGVKSVTINGTTYTTDGSTKILEGSRVDWSAKAESGYSIDGAEAGNMIVRKDETLNITASADPVYYTLSWTINSHISAITINGTRYTSSGSRQLLEGSKVTWSAEATTGWLVDGADSGTFYIDSDTNLSPTASAAPVDQYRVSWSIDDGIASITVNGTKYTANGSIMVDEGSTVNWSATAKPDYTVDAPSSGSVTVFKAETITVTSTPVVPDPEYTFEWYIDSGVASITVNGTTYNRDGSITVSAGSTVGWSAVAKSGYRITSVSSGSVTMNGDRSVNVTTERIPEEYTFSWTIDAHTASITVNGTRYTGDGSITVTEGSNVSWTAVAMDGYHIVSGAPGNVTMTGNKSTAVITEQNAPDDPDYTVTLRNNCDGVASYSFNGGGTSRTGKLGESFSWTATAATGYTYGGSKSTSGTVVIDGSAYAYIDCPDEIEYTVTLSGCDDMTYSFDGGGTSFTGEYGDSYSWTATAKTGYSWGGSTTTSGSGFITGDRTINISCPDPITYTITLKNNCTGVASYGFDGGGTTFTGELGESFSWSADAKTGYTYGNGSGDSTSGSGTITGNQTINVPCPEEIQYTVTLNNPCDGVASYSFSGGGTSKTGKPGTSYSWSATAKTGYKWGNSTSTSGSGTITGDATIDIPCPEIPTPVMYTFSWDSDDGVASAGAGGKSGLSGSVTVAKGTTVSYSGTAKTGYRFTNGSGSGSVVVNSDTHHSFTTEPITYTVTLGHNCDGIDSYSFSGGGISKTGAAGTSYSWTARAKSGYKWGNSSSTSGSGTITGDGTITIPCPDPEPKTYTFSWSCDGDMESITVNGVTYYGDDCFGGSITVPENTWVSWGCTPRVHFVVDGTNGSGSVFMTSNKGVSIRLMRDPDNP